MGKSGLWPTLVIGAKQDDFFRMKLPNNSFTELGNSLSSTMCDHLRTILVTKLCRAPRQASNDRCRSHYASNRFPFGSREVTPSDTLPLRFHVPESQFCELPHFTKAALAATAVYSPAGLGGMKPSGRFAGTGGGSSSFRKILSTSCNSTSCLPTRRSIASIFRARSSCLASI